MLTVPIYVILQYFLIFRICIAKRDSLRQASQTTGGGIWGMIKNVATGGSSESIFVP